MIHAIGDPILFASPEEWGGKGMNLLELGETFNVPRGFVLSSDAYRDFLTPSLESRIRSTLDSNSPEDAYLEIQKILLSSQIPGQVRQGLEEGIMDLDGAVLAVRSSAIDEDGSLHSFAGQHQTFLGVQGIDDVVRHVLLCYASLFNPVAMQYRKTHNLQFPEAMAVVVQELINSDIGGIAYSATRADPDAVLIEAVHGLCVGAVDGKAVDVFKGKKESYETNFHIQKKISKNKRYRIVYDPKKGQVVSVKNFRTGRETLRDEQVQEVCKIAREIESYNSSRARRQPVDIEFCYSGDELYLLQSRPITGLKTDIPDITLPDISILAETFNVGNPGIVDAPIIVIDEVDPLGTRFRIKGNVNIAQLNQQYAAGYILVTPETNPELDRYLTNCVGMVITEGGIMGHAGATAAEKGILFIGSVEGVNGGTKFVRNLDHGSNYCLAANREKGIFGLRR